MSLWKPASVMVEPETRLESWRVYRVHAVGDYPESIHFAGQVIGRGIGGGGGRVCSPVQEFDMKTMRGVTRSGRVYELVGPSGISGDAMYVWGQWANAYATNGYTDITDEYDRDSVPS